MIHSVTRRRLLIGLPLLAGFSVTPTSWAGASSLANVEQRHGGRLGVFALDTGSGRTLAWRADERFLMCSTFKGLLAGQILARVDAGQEQLDRLVPYTEHDLIFTSPVTQVNVTHGALPVGTLLDAILEQSDNTAAVLLMRSAGGPAGLTEFVRQLGDNVTRSDRYEPESNNTNGVLDTTSPRAIVTTAQRLLLDDVLGPSSRAILEQGMVNCKPGLNRLRAALPDGWQGADRPGTSIEKETNDYLLARPPGAAPLLIAAYYDAPGKPLAEREAVLREVGGLFVQWATAF
ncbi:class A beta-lactamase [Mycolicibacterium aubagnense]|uniref:Beta-lactamase n=1 Tax=Mycolicibacterium aubagnense TaxID=319707 RepID=A0ABN5YLQ2_9MYCO|nr:class A beta-lactamase [Mycolicibacterium aubagnense]TLH62254.1 class A beta-lactamase [Mycolicibacterium aubagnense]WGI30447.1 class A beta-lactamase [Mycolicibacterium aubagnense]BBX82651.1 beta-lactamase [Mycolicibacterium aubagnense]